jgi:hypothetical protein
MVGGSAASRGGSRLAIRDGIGVQLQQVCSVVRSRLDTVAAVPARQRVPAVVLPWFADSYLHTCQKGLVQMHMCTDSGMLVHQQLWPCQQQPATPNDYHQLCCSF